MVLKAVFLEFSGVLIKDTDLQRRLIDEILIAENLRPDPTEFAQVCFGRSDRPCLNQLLTRRGRVISKKSLDKLLQKKSEAYIQALSVRKRLPLYPGLQDFLYQLRTAALPVGLVTGAGNVEVDWVLAKANLATHFAVKVTGDEIAIDEDKPATTVYELAIARLNEHFPGLEVTPEECLAVEASFVGIAAAKKAHIPVVGVAHLYPYRMIQRRAIWAVDYLNEITLDWVRQRYEPKPSVIKS
ncbi:MAG: HAD family phosphatase [Cyanobacteria bacterium J06639_14]